jgi:serine/threonine-protein kinase
MDEERWGRISALLDELFELEPGERERRLAQVAAEDSELAAELRRLLAADQRSGVLDDGVFAGSDTLAEGMAERIPLSATAGLRLGHYRLVERVGSGGMGEVWRAQREDDFEQQVAVKLIRPLVDGPALRERFARERQILARLDHANIARLLDGGLAEDGTPWYAMEFVRGAPLNVYVNQEQLDVRARVQLLLQVCDAVAHAHGQLVVHRDLKPSNILVDGEGRVRVLDFGIARLLDDSADLRLTSTGVRVFSPAYAAPEQIRGEPVGTAADVFALGAVLFELLTGEPPFPTRSGQPERLLAQINDEVAPRPSATLRERSRGASRSTGSLRADDDLDTIVSTALQPDPDRRYRGAVQLGEDLRRWLDGRPIAARPDSAAYRMRKFVSRHRLAVGSASSVLLALVGGLGVALWQADVARGHAVRADAEAERANREAERAEREATQAKDQAQRTRKALAFFVESYVHANPLSREIDSPATVAEALDAAIERAKEDLADDPSLQADVLDDFGEIRAGQGRFDDAQALLEQALASAEKAHGASHPAVAETLLNLAAVQSYRGDYLAGAPYTERAVAILEADAGGQPASLANALNSLSTIKQQRGDMPGAQSSLQRAADIYEVHAPEHPGRMVAMTNLAMMAMGAGQYKEAEASFRRVAEQVEARMGPHSPHLWPSLFHLAVLAYERGDHDEELALSRRALEVAQHNYAQDHPWVADSLGEVGWILGREGQMDVGEPLLREAIAMQKRLGQPQAIGTIRRLAMAMQHNGRSAEALGQLDEAWGLCERNGLSAQQDCVVLRANRAHLLALAGEGERALAEAEAALAGVKALGEGLINEIGQAEQAKAAALAASGRRDEAIELQQSVIANLRNAYPGDHRELRSAEGALKRLQASP